MQNEKPAKQIVKATDACTLRYMHMLINSLTWLNANGFCFIIVLLHMLIYNYTIIFLGMFSLDDSTKC